MAKATADPAAGLKKLKKKAKRKEPKGKQELRVVAVPADLKPQVRQLCELAHIMSVVDPLFKQHKTAVQGEFFDLWTAEMWEKKVCPDNFNAKLKQLGADGAETPLDDTLCQFQLKFRTAGLQSKLPNEDDLPEVDCECDSDPDCKLCQGEGTYTKTVQEVLVEILMSAAVGLSEEHARSFVDDEVTITDDFDFAMPINKMTQQGEDSPLKTLGDKLVAYMSARPRKEGGKVNAAGITDDEVAEGLKYYQVVTLKDKLLDRIVKYAADVEQLRKLLTFIAVTKQVANFDYGISDEAVTRIERLKEAVGRYFVPDEEAE
jgi:hypothetical protein